MEPEPDGGSGSSRRAGVLGSPIAHSLSPVLHRAAYAALGLDWRYDAYEVDVRSLPDFLAGLDRSWVGLSLTMPLKQAVIPLCDAVSPLAGRAGAVNTVLVRPDGSRYGDNTDAPGLVAALADAGVRRVPDRVAVLGAGATATSALAALAAMSARPAPIEPAPIEPAPIEPAPIEVYARTPARAAELIAAASRIGVRVEVRDWSDLAAGLTADLVISTVPVAGSAEIAAAVPAGRVGGLLFDVGYEPWPTPLAAAWQARGGAVVGGLGLLIHQAVRQVELMTGRTGMTAQLVAVMSAALRDRGRSIGLGLAP